jgi:hypothetical protein
MNTKLLELAKQAGLKKPHGSDIEYIGDFDWRLFGELVVKECANWLDRQDKSRCPYGVDLEEHFGVNNESN